MSEQTIIALPEVFSSDPFLFEDHNVDFNMGIKVPMITYRGQDDILSGEASVKFLKSLCPNSVLYPNLSKLTNVGLLPDTNEKAQLAVLEFLAVSGREDSDRLKITSSISCDEKRYKVNLRYTKGKQEILFSTVTLSENHLELKQKEGQLGSMAIVVYERHFVYPYLGKPTNFLFYVSYTNGYLARTDPETTTKVEAEE